MTILFKLSSLTPKQQKAVEKAQAWLKIWRELRMISLMDCEDPVSKDPGVHLVKVMVADALNALKIAEDMATEALGREYHWQEWQ